ncbi:hypothetical protein BHE74_00015450 [Ensete ventricosum]|nr:hypothetical protein BHE74_00015450 [Ensete ventricosum]
MGVLIPIKPLNSISLKVDGSNLHPSSIGGSVESKIPFLSPCYDFFGLGGRPMMNSVKRDRVFSSWLSNASNLVLMASSDTMVYASRLLNTTTVVYHSIPLLPSSATVVYIAVPSSSYYNRTLATTDATCSHEVAPQS